MILKNVSLFSEKIRKMYETFCVFAGVSGNKIKTCFGLV